MPDSITSAPYRGRFTFPAITTTVTDIAVVGGEFPDTIGEVDVGEVSVGEQRTTTEGSYNWRKRYQFDVDELTP